MNKSTEQQFVIIARPTPPGDKARYLMERVHVLAKNWAEAYKKVREMDYVLFVDEYEPKPGF